jgi:hypothetical protein
MNNTEEEKCPFLSNGKCTVENIDVFRDNECANEAKDACCFTCTRREQCEIGCDSWSSMPGWGVNTQAELREELTEETAITVGSDVLWRFYGIVGALLLTVGLIWILYFSSTEASYLELILARWDAYVAVGSPSRLFDFLSSLTWLFLVIVGIVLILYASLRLRSKKETEPTHKSTLARWAQFLSLSRHLVAVAGRDRDAFCSEVQGCAVRSGRDAREDCTVS